MKKVMVELTFVKENLPTDANDVLQVGDTVVKKGNKLIIQRQVHEAPAPATCREQNKPCSPNFRWGMLECSDCDWEEEWMYE